MQDKEVVIHYFNRHRKQFELFFRGSEEHARLFMETHGHLHSAYKIEVKDRNEAQEVTTAV